MAGEMTVNVAVDASAALSALDNMLAFHKSVEAMVAMLESGEWAEHVASTIGKGYPLACRLESAITELHNKLYEGYERAFLGA